MHTTVFEYGYLTHSKDAESLGASRISSRAFKYLKEVSLSAQESDLCKCLSLTKRYGVELIQVKNYVGVLFTLLVSILRCCRKSGVKLLVKKAQL